MKKTNISLVERLEKCKKTKKCLDKVEIISLVHNTGHVNLITTKGKVLKITVSDLIDELLLDQMDMVKQNNCAIFGHVLTIKYTAERSKQFDQIFLQSKLTYVKTEIGNWCINVTVKIDNQIIVTNPINERDTNYKNIPLISS